MLPIGATVGPSVRPPLIGSERVTAVRVFASGARIFSPVGFGTSAAQGQGQPHEVESDKGHEAHCGSPKVMALTRCGVPRTATIGSRPCERLGRFNDECRNQNVETMTKPE